MIRQLGLFFLGNVLIAIVVAAVKLYRGGGLRGLKYQLNGAEADGSRVLFVMKFAYILLILSATSLLQSSFFPGNDRLGNFIFVALLLGTPLLMVMCYVILRGDWLTYRVYRREKAGDRAGAIAQLRADLDGELTLNVATLMGSIASPQRFRAARRRLQNRVVWMGALYARDGDWSSALHWLRQASSLGMVADAGCQANLGMALIKSGHEDEGITVYNAAIDLLMPSKVTEKLQMIEFLSQTLESQRRWGEALALLDRAEELLKSPFAPAKHHAEMVQGVEGLRRKMLSNEAKDWLASPQPPAQTADVAAALDARGDRV